MYEIIFHGRGGQGALLAARILANAYFFDGKYIEAFPHFGGERRGAPVRAFLRVDDKPVKSNAPIESADSTIVLDASLLEYIDIARGLKEESLVVLNTPLKPDEIKLSSKHKLATCDATKIALETIGKDIPNSALLGAFLFATGLSREVLAKGFSEVFINEAAARKNMEMAKRAAALTNIGFSEVKAEPKEKEATKIGGLEIGGTFKAQGLSCLNTTSSWTIFRAIIDYQKCSNCLLCYVLCPEACILREKELIIDENHCKGCGICEQVCPKKAIKMQRKSK